MFNGYFPWHLENVTGRSGAKAHFHLTSEPCEHLSGIKDKQDSAVITGYMELLSSTHIKLEKRIVTDRIASWDQKMQPDPR